MKQRSTTPVSKKLVTKSALVATAVMMVLAAPLAMTPRVHADEFDAKINALEKEISEYQSRASEQGRKAINLQAEINKLNAEKAVIQKQIDLSQARYDKLQRQIKETEKKISDNKDALGITLADLYVDDEISPLEMLASSSNIGDYVDKQTYRSSVSDQLKETIATINDLKKELEEQKWQVEATLKDQKKQRKLLADKEAEKQSLLSQTRGKQEAFNKLVKTRDAQVNKLRQQQAAAMEAARQSGGGLSSGSYISSSYPWLGKSMNYNDSCIYPDGSSGADPWGYCYRQCVSYVAWKLATDGRGSRNFSGMGNAGNWDAYGSPVSSNNVRPGDVIVWNIDYYGHVVYVESVSNGTIYYTQANANWSGLVSDGSMPVSQLDGVNYVARRYR